MRIISLNVNGIQDAVERGLLPWLKAQNADVICLQDTRASSYDMDDPAYALEGYILYACDAEVPSQGGVALYTRVQPKAVAICRQTSTRSASPACCCPRASAVTKT